VSDLSPTENQRIRFEEVTPANTVVAFLDAKLLTLASRFALTVFWGYDDLDSLKFAFLQLPSGKIVTLGEYENSPQAGVDLYIDLSPLGIPAPEIPTVVVEALRVLDIHESQVTWLHPDFDAEIKRNYSNLEASSSTPDAAIPNIELESHLVTDPVECFQFALKIYTRGAFPNYWAMLQHNLGLAYYHRKLGNPQQNLETAIAYFQNSQDVYTAEVFPEKWQLNQEDLQVAQQALKELLTLIQDIRERPINHRQLGGINLSGADLSEANLGEAILRVADLSWADLSGANFGGADLSGANFGGADLSGANLSGANLFRANLNGADLRGADLRGANLSGADLSRANLGEAYLRGANLLEANLIGADLSGADLSEANVRHCNFSDGIGLSESQKSALRAQGAIFSDSPGDRSGIGSPIPTRR
jgi:uncharacterized protein YjbI with pentapeptide repeats